MMTTENWTWDDIAEAFADMIEGEVEEETTEVFIVDVLFNPPATIVFWSDGSKTVVKAQDGETFDAEKGLAMAIVKRVTGNKGNYNDIFREWVGDACYRE